MIASHTIQNVSFQDDFLVLKMDGKEFKISLDKASPKLKAATTIERGFYKISPSGYGIHWALIDEDLSVNALLASQSK